MERLYFTNVTLVLLLVVMRYAPGDNGAGWLIVRNQQKTGDETVGKMKENSSLQINPVLSSRELLLNAVLDMWETQGAAGISTRALVAATGLPVSSIYYHFGDMEQLFLAAQHHAIDCAKRWCIIQLDMIGTLDDPGSEALAPLLATLIDDWSHGHRRLAFAWRECCLLARRNPAFQEAMRAWQMMWSAFWQEICERFGQPDRAEATSFFFDGESLLHMMRWRPVVDRACLDETCRGWISLLDGRLSPEGYWRRHARMEAARTVPKLLVKGGMAEQIAQAAATVVDKFGIRNLTHRAVAAEAGVTLGVVSYNFRTSAELVGGALEMIYRRIILSPDSLTPDSTVGGELALMLTTRQKAHARKSASDDLMVEIARNPALDHFALQTRYLRGRTSGRMLESMVGPGKTVSPLDAALFSSFNMGLLRACAGMDEQELNTHIDRHLDELTSRLTAGTPPAKP